MKKRILALLLALTLLTACAPATPETSEAPAIPESPTEQQPQPEGIPSVPEVLPESTQPTVPETPVEPETPTEPQKSGQHEEVIEEFRRMTEEIEDYQAQWRAEAKTQAELNTASAETFRRLEELRGQILSYLKGTLDTEAGSALDAEEKLWEQAREAAQKDAAAALDSGSGAPLQYYSTGNYHTIRHCYDLIRRLSGPVTVEWADWVETADHVFVMEDRYSSGSRGPRFVFRTAETAYDVTVNTLDNAVYEYAGHEELYRIEELRPGETLLTELYFAGIRTYGLFYTDSSGVRHCWDFCMSMKGTGDSLLFSEFAYTGASVDSALRDEAPIRIPELAESRKLSDWISTDGAEFAFVDLDADGAQEAVVRTLENVLVIDEIGGQACGALLSFRSLYDLCLSGVFSWNDTDSDGSWYGQARLEITPEGCRRTVLWKTLKDGTTGARYFLGEQEVSQTDLTQYLNDHPARGEAIFVPLTKAQPLS